MASRARSRLRPAISYLAAVTALAAVYFLMAGVGLRYASIGHSVSLVWPPTGIAFGALTILGYRYWPGVALGAFLANAVTPISIPAAAAIAVGNTLEGLVAAFLLRRAAGPRPRLEVARSLRTLVLVAAPAGALVSAAVGATTLWMARVISGASIPLTVAVWWTGDLLGALVVAPVLLTWAASRERFRIPRGVLEITLLCLGTVVAAELVMGPGVRLPLLGKVDYLYLLFPFVMWAALRFGARGASLITLTLAIVAVWHTTHGAGLFIAGSSMGTMFAVACYLGVVAIAGLAIAAAVTREQESATEILRQRDAQLRVALDAACMGIWSWSAENDTLVWDDTLRRLYGLRPTDQVKRYEDFLSRVHPDDREFVDQTVRRAFGDAGRLDYEFRIILPDGGIRWIADHGRVISAGPDRAAAMSGVCMDVTERRATEEQLRHAHRMESVGRLAGGVAHEANNQMSVVLSAADFVLRRHDIPEAVRMDMDYIRRAAERTAAVTSQLLAFSRRQILSPQVLDLNAAVRRFEATLRRVMGEDCAVRLRLSEHLQPIKADPGQLDQIFLNLALNARDAMPRGGALTVETFPAELSPSTWSLKPAVYVRPGSYAALAMTDTGHGMDKETLSHIFEPFFTTKGIGEGTGLGLSTVYGIVKQSDGYVWAYSEPGQGTTFKVYLATSTEPLDSGQPEAGREQSASGELILVVEDEEQVRKIAGRALQEAGYQVREASSGQEALEILTAGDGRVALVLTDVVMPGMTGKDLAASITEVAPSTAVLFISGYTDGEIVRRGLLSPDAALVQKPFTPNGLVKAVKERLAAQVASQIAHGPNRTGSGREPSIS
jgi:two-component system cell cycle sensor histidine kinase/response regulator CckA